MIKLLLSRGADPLLTNTLGNTPLHYLGYPGNPDLQMQLFDELMSAGANLNMQNNEKVTPPYLAIELNMLDVMRKATTEFGDSINYTFKLGSNGTTLAEHAKELGQESITPFFNNTNNTVLGLDSTQDVNIRNAQGYAGVHLAAIMGNADYLKKLIGRGADLTAKGPRQGNTPLFMAAAFGFSDVVNVIIQHAHAGTLEQARAIAATVNSSGRTIPMALLGIRSLPERMKMLNAVVAQGAHLNAVDNQGNTLLHLSVMHGNPEWVKMLLKEFGNVLDKTIKNNEGRTPRALAEHLDEQNMVVVF